MRLEANRLWAKSKRDDEPIHASMYLGGHLLDVSESARRVLDATADDQLYALGLNPEDYRDRLRRIVLLAAACHDLGKANDHFQEMIRRERNILEHPQGLRHEWVSLLIIRELRGWLLPAVAGDERDFAIVEWSVCGHHPAHNHDSPPRTCPPGAGPEIRVLADHEDFLAICERFREAFSLGAVPAVALGTLPLVNAGNVFRQLFDWWKTSHRLWESAFFGKSETRLTAAAKNCLIAADLAGSALPNKLPHDPNRWDWIAQSFDSKPHPQDLEEIVRLRLKGNLPRPFQTAVADSTASVTFVKAGCGSGKTLAAYMWAANNYPQRRLYFCYPTTGTATEGFKDYLFDADVKAELFHSRREIDFEIILSTGEDVRNEDFDVTLRIDALDAWSTPIVACTVDTVLGLVQNNKRGLFSWPALSQSAFIFDEIHAYDDRLFGALLRFLRDLPGLPALLMTASLPAPRLTALRTTLEKWRGIKLEPIAGPTDLEELPRYRKAVVKDDNPLPLARESYERQGKILWVCNTVQRVMDAAAAAESHGLETLLYHSRFKYEDRIQRHKDVIEAFDPAKNSGPALAICSQVAEMSLDLSADLLVTDLAPVPAIIQRLGRLNRRARAGDPTKPFAVVEPDGHLPYSSDELNASRAWYGQLGSDAISQRELADKWEQSAENPPESVPSAWLDGGPTTTVSELREASPGVTVLMGEDIAKIVRQPKSLGRYTLPMPPPPKSMNWREWPRHRGVPIAPAGTILYESQRGAQWQRK